MANENLSQNHIKIWVGTMIRDWNKILLWHRCKNKKDTGWIHEPDTRCFPWWKQEYDETVVQAAIREAREETNLDIKNPKVFTVIDSIAPDRHFITIWFICDEFEWKLKCMEPDKEDERRRFDLNDLPENLYSPSKDLLDYYKKNLN
mgnify:CR=1 FL=1